MVVCQIYNYLKDCISFDYVLIENKCPCDINSYQQIRRFFIRKILISFLFLHENICCGYSLEAPRRGASNEYHKHMFSWRNKKILCGYPLLSVAMINCPHHWLHPDSKQISRTRRLINVYNVCFSVKHDNNKHNKHYQHTPSVENGHVQNVEVGERTWHKVG